MSPVANVLKRIQVVPCVTPSSLRPKVWATAVVMVVTTEGPPAHTRSHVARADGSRLCFLALPPARVSEEEVFQPRTGLAPTRGRLPVEESQIGAQAFTGIPRHPHGLEIKIDDMDLQCFPCIKRDTETQSWKEVGRCHGTSAPPLVHVRWCPKGTETTRRPHNTQKQCHSGLSSRVCKR